MRTNKSRARNTKETSTPRKRAQPELFRYSPSDMLLLVRYSFGGLLLLVRYSFGGGAATRPLLVRWGCCYSPATRPRGVLVPRGALAFRVL